MLVINILERAYLKNSLIDHLDEVVSVVLQQARVCRIKTLYIRIGISIGPPKVALGEWAVQGA